MYNYLYKLAAGWDGGRAGTWSFSSGIPHPHLLIDRVTSIFITRGSGLNGMEISVKVGCDHI
jgi:hypothetical protein